MSNNTPPKTFKRNEFGLIDDESVKYVFNNDGTVDWRKMVKPEFLAPNKQNFERSGKPVPKSIEGLDDKDLIILLPGIKELAQIRGFNAVKHTVTCPTNDYVVSVCSIEWIPNHETEGRPISFSAIGDASFFNTTSFGKTYLAAVAENRAFVRAVRNFLKINIVAQEELGASGSQEQESSSSAAVLKDTMDSCGVTFEKIKDTLVKEKWEGAESFTKLNDIPKFKQFELVERIKKAASKPKQP